VGNVSAVTEVWERKVIHGVQWSDKTEKQNDGGRISIARYSNITFPEGTFENVVFSYENDAIVYGEVTDVVTTTKGSRLSDLLEKYPKSGRIKSVNDNSNREFLKNIKVVVG